MDELILELLAGSAPIQARRFVLAWGERRNTSWMDAHSQAAARTASDGHLPQLRGQLRHHFGERALAEAAREAKLGSFPLESKPAGGVFTVARVGRFALVSLSVRTARQTPRRSLTRKLLAQPNEELDRQSKLPFGGSVPSRGATELAYLGCVVAVPARRDPTVPAELAIGVPNAALNDWVAWIPLSRAFMLLQEMGDGLSGKSADDGAVPDKALPRFRLPKKDEGAGGGDEGA